MPAPFGPSSPVTPAPSSNEIPLTATTFPYQRETSRTATVLPLFWAQASAPSKDD